MAKSASVRERLSLTSTSHQISGVMQPEAQSMSSSMPRASGGSASKSAFKAASIFAVLSNMPSLMSFISSIVNDSGELVAKSPLR